MTQARLELDDYSKRVLDVVKGKFGLKNRSEALVKFCHEYGDAFVEEKPNEMFLRDLDQAIYETEKNKNNKDMSIEELDDLLGL